MRMSNKNVSKDQNYFTLPTIKRKLILILCGMVTDVFIIQLKIAAEDQKLQCTNSALYLCSIYDDTNDNFLLLPPIALN